MAHQWRNRLAQGLGPRAVHCAGNQREILSKSCSIQLYRRATLFCSGRHGVPTPFPGGRASKPDGNGDTHRPWRRHFKLLWSLSRGVSSRAWPSLTTATAPSTAPSARKHKRLDNCAARRLRHTAQTSSIHHATLTSHTPLRASPLALQYTFTLLILHATAAL